MTTSKEIANVASDSFVLAEKSWEASSSFEVTDKNANPSTTRYAIPSSNPIIPNGPDGNPPPVVATKYSDIHTIGCESKPIIPTID